MNTQKRYPHSVFVNNPDEDDDDGEDDGHSYDDDVMDALTGSG